MKVLTMSKENLMSSSISKKYLQEKMLGEVGIPAPIAKAGTALATGAGILNTGLAGAAPALQSAAILGLPAMVYSAADGIKNIILRSKWDRKGCDAEIDPQRKMMCQARARNILIANLGKEKASKCAKAKDPQACQETFDNKINMVRQQQTNETYSYPMNESLLAMGAIGLGGAALGALAQKGLSSYKNRYLTCRLIKDPFNRDKCTMGIIDSMISNLQDVSNRVCEKTPDPAQCKLEMLKKIERLSIKKQRLQQHLSRSERVKLLDREDLNQ